MLQSPCRSRVSPRSSIHCARARPFVCSCADRSGSAASACGRPLEPVVSVKVVNLPAGSALSRAPVVTLFDKEPQETVDSTKITRWSG